MRSDVPYFEKTYICPVCGKESSQYFLRDRSYLIEERDSDQYIRKFRWVKPEYNKFHIYFFHIAYCPHCNFADENFSFIQKKSGQSLYQFENLKKIFLQMAPEDAFIKTILPYIEYPVESLQGALNLHFLAIYIQRLPKSYQIDMEKVARLFLRTSWLFHIASADSFIGRTLSEIESYMEKYERLQNNIVNILHDIEDLKDWYEEKERREKEHPQISLWLPYRDQFHSIYRSMTRGLDQILTSITGFGKIGEGAKKKFLESDRNPFKFPYASFSNYYEFLLHLKENWASIPGDEETALKKAIYYFKEIIRSQIYETNKFKLFGIFDMVIILYTKLKDYDNALYFSQLLAERINNLRTAAQRRLDRLKIIRDDTVDPNSLQNYIQKCNDLIQSNNKRRRQIVKLKLEVDENRARILFNKYRELSPVDLEEKLAEENIAKPIIKKYVEERQKEKKKGIFQIFKI